MGRRPWVFPFLALDPRSFSVTAVSASHKSPAFALFLVFFGESQEFKSNFSTEVKMLFQRPGVLPWILAQNFLVVLVNLDEIQHSLKRDAATKKTFQKRLGFTLGGFSAVHL
jgi:hypothetical protein